MGWAVGFDKRWSRDIGYGVIAHCDHPGCRRVIDRGLAFVCGGEPFGGSNGCGLYFCSKHLFYKSKKNAQACEQCLNSRKPFGPKPDHKKWMHFKMTNWSWADWRKEHGLPEPKRMRKPAPDDIVFEIGIGYC